MVFGLLDSVLRLYCSTAVHRYTGFCDLLSKRRSRLVGLRSSCALSFSAARAGRSPLFSSLAATPLRAILEIAFCPYSFQIPNLQ